MTEHLSPVQLEDWLRRRLAPEELLGADDHLAECAECRRLVESALNNEAAALYAELATDAVLGTHPTFEQSAAFVDGLISGEERRMIEDHLASCAQCAPLVADLRVFRNEVALDLDREYRPETMAAGASWLTRFKAVLPAPLSNIPVWVYAAAPVILLLAVAWWIVWRGTPNERSPQIVITSPTPAPSPLINRSSPTPVIAPVIVKLTDGGSSLTLDANGAITGVDQWPSEYQRLAREALTAQRVEKSPLLAGLSRPGSSLMGGDDEGRRFAAIEPAGKVLLTDRPTFRWSRLSGATGYIVEVYGARFNLVSSSPLLTSVSWTATPLARGQVYSWQVKAIKDGQDFKAPRPPAPEAKFRILDQSTANEIARARADYSSSHLLLGLLYARSGLIAEADQEFHALQKDNPDSVVARRLLETVQTLRR
ncbi:MAG TPA: zf-HC2 domain-containing protein [Blastocatellia bacterium]|nr:zf-HC2 domain-containing protein [Blastocatellia bacterium]